MHSKCYITTSPLVAGQSSQVTGATHTSTRQLIKMPKNILAFDLQRPSTNVPWGFVICGGRDMVRNFTLKYM